MDYEIEKTQQTLVRLGSAALAVAVALPDKPARISRKELIKCKKKKKVKVCEEGRV